MSEERKPFQLPDKYGDLVPRLKPSRCPCDDPCQRVRNGDYDRDTGGAK